MLRPTASTYDLYGRFYDVLEIFFRSRLADAVGALPLAAGDRVLDIGVGTGFSLPHYPEQVKVTAIDNSPVMLQRAQRRLATGKVKAQVELLQADALALPFEDGTFDAAVLTHVITTVADPDRCLIEAARVTREAGILMLVNHFRSQYPPLRRLERTINPVCRRLGWRSDLSLGGLLYRVGAKYDEMEWEGEFIRTLYLQKWRGELRVIHLPRQTAVEPAPAAGLALQHIYSGGLPDQSLPSPGAR